MSKTILRQLAAPTALLSALSLNACGSAATQAEEPVAVVVAAPAAEPSPPEVDSPPAPTSPSYVASDFTMDGFKLGDRFGQVMKRPPYDQPCDNDPIDDRARRFMVYGALPCRERSFPEGTTVAFYIRYSDADRYAQPIEAFAWLGGDYFATRSDFPLKTGVDRARADAALGESDELFELRRSDHRLVVRGHPGPIYSLADGETIVGYVLGPMPADGDNEQWRGLMQMYVRYTLPPQKERPAGKDIPACCTALRMSARSAAPGHKGRYLAAAGACDALRHSAATAQQLTKIMQQVLSGATVPEACRLGTPP